MDIAPKTIKNVTFIRNSNSTCVTNLLYIQYKYNVRIENVTIETPTGTGLYFDSCIRVWDSAKILMEKIKIHNTYCASNQYGYGIEMDNVWDSHFEHLEAYQTERGVFATNNTNEFYISNSELNRVDIHCYGKNVTCVNCDFRKGNNNDQFYNRFSSFYGTLTYRNCRFHDFIPVRLDSEYDSFAPYDVVMENCVLNVTTTVAHVCNIPIIHNNRWQGVSNLVPRSLPRLYITNLRVNVSQDVQYFLLFYIGQVENNANRNFDYLNELNVDVSIFGENPSNPLNIWGSNYQIYVNGTLNTEFYVSRPTQTTVLYITSNIS